MATKAVQTVAFTYIYTAISLFNFPSIMSINNIILDRCPCLPHPFISHIYIHIQTNVKVEVVEP